MEPEAPAPAPELVLFDLDGTLADTFPDLERALGRALGEHGLPPADRAAVRARVSEGARAMTEAATRGRAADDDAVRRRFLELYRENVAVETTLFEGMHAVLDALDRHGRGFGVVTNKLAYYTEPLVDALGLRPRLRCLVSGDTAPRPKPHPDPLLHAAAVARVAPGSCVYVGDARKDVQAARAAGMRVVVAAYGYLPPGEDPQDWRPDALIGHPRALLEWLGVTS